MPSARAADDQTGGTTDVVTIRGFQPGDLDALYDICVRTTDDGGDGRHLHDDHRLPGHVFAAPYGVLEPEHCFVAVDDEGVGGYVVGALDSPTFDAAAETQWWPALREQHPAPDHSRAGEWTKDDWQRFFIHTPITADPNFVDEYPSHLHIDLLPRMQGMGVGRRLMDTFLDALRADGSPGVYLGVSPGNTNAIGFYRHYGFTALVSNDVQVVFAMKLTS